MSIITANKLVIQIGFCRQPAASLLKHSFVQDILVTYSYICIWSRASIVLSLFLIFDQIWASLFL